MDRTQPLWADAIEGAIAGALATWVMGKVTTALYAREEKSAKQREDDARGGKTAYGVAAEKIAGAAGRSLDDDERARYGSAIHWALGASAGAVYGMVRPRVSGASLGRGLVFGTAVFLVMDELATAALGLTPGPAVFPWQAHARGLAGHLAFGLTADAALAAAGAVGAAGAAASVGTPQADHHRLTS